ncbi:YciI family protein [Pararhizobium antarcticum]|uniref:YCII-related domain-containing protein n=1 Tax=Pararhizobium antarcticum TaxID=1798805 RepID=A0A657LVM7_9HYPH|nr:YciI family protein [Pararhizobium antarcticum]OJF93287.1 hypothetical protein AX761_20255 [Rhizobium sp. 58]OJF99529.1 hypothetical protein AX760_12305 [Pararhizobium antarcticum]
MLYAILCYNDETVTTAWSDEKDRETMARLAAVEARLAQVGRLGPVARLLPTTSATTLRKGRDELVITDGPFAETKEQLLGFFIIDCNDLEEALSAAHDLARANPEGGAYEIRPLAIYKPGETRA